ncbi:MAG: type II toxin-antitoxin system VapC family toxin [bacterium]|nr:type II toxin-antitoxin system VapC family toxin [bacterium]
MYVLDTDTLSRLHRGHPGMAERLRGLQPSPIVTTVVSRIELLRGRFDFLLKAANGEQLLRAHQWLVRTEELLAELRVLSPDARSAALFDRLRTNRRLRKIGRADLLIGSIALANQATLVTRNLRHFRQIPELKVVNWIDQ